MTRSPALERMMTGEAPQTPEEWVELGLFLSTMARFMSLVNAELDAMEYTFDVIEKTIEVLADAQEPHVQALLKEVVNRAYQSKGLHLPEVQEDDIIFPEEGPIEPGSGGELPQEG